MDVAPLSKGDPATGVKAPVLGLIEKTEILPLWPLLTHSSVPSGLIAYPNGLMPTATGEPMTDNAPVEALRV
jgi:hypothetical protein